MKYGSDRARHTAAPALAAIVVLVVLLAGCRPTGRVAQQLPTIVTTGESNRLAAVDVFGVVRAGQVRSLVLEFTARIVTVPALTGSIVGPADPIVLIDAREAFGELAGLEAQITAARLRLAQRSQELGRANVNLTQEDAALEREIAAREAELSRTARQAADLRRALADGTDLDLLALEAEIGRLEADLEYAERDLELGRRLSEQGGLASAELDRRQRSAADLATRIGTARLQREQLTRQKLDRIEDLEFTARQLTGTLGSLRARLATLMPPDVLEIRIQEAQIEQLEIQHERLASRLERDFLSGDPAAMQVRSPIGAAVVSEIVGAPGDLVSAGTRIARLEATDILVVEAFVPEEFIRDVTPRAVADIVALADRSRTYRGRVEHISGVAEQRGNETVFRIRVSIDDPDAFLRPNMNVDMSIRPPAAGSGPGAS